MSKVVIIISMAVTAYVLRFSGLALSQRTLPSACVRFLRFVPLAVFTSLIVLALPGTQGEGGIRVIAALCAGMAILRVRQPWVGLLVGLGVFWLLRFAGFGR